MVPDIRANPYLYIQLADSQQPRNCWACQRGIGVHKNIAATSLRSAAACSRAGGVARHIGIDDRLHLSTVWHAMSLASHLEGGLPSEIPSLVRPHTR